MQVERIEDMQVGDFIELPQAEWDLNEPAKAMLAAAQLAMEQYQGDGPRPQYQINSYPPEGMVACIKHRLERIR